MKGKLSALGYAIAVPCAFVRPWVAGTLYATVALMWITPDRRIERIVAAEAGPASHAELEAAADDGDRLVGRLPNTGDRGASR